MRRWVVGRWVMVGLVVLAVLAASAGAVLAGGQAPVTASGPSLTGETWYWQESIRSDDSRTRPQDSTRYTLMFLADGRLQAQVDCNRGMGTYTTGPGNRLTIGLLATTRMACPPGSLDSRFLADLDQIDRYTFLSNVTLRLEPRGDTSTMLFTRVP